MFFAWKKNGRLLHAVFCAIFLNMTDFVFLKRYIFGILKIITKKITK